MEWPRLLAYITGTVDQELLLRNEYLAAENRILGARDEGENPAVVQAIMRHSR
jgi:putative transposase